MGNHILENAWLGYNATCFAYGQTGSGKSFSMVGSKEQPGIIPRAVQAIFERIDQSRLNGDSFDFKVEASMLEIYNEKVRDLLNLGSNERGWGESKEGNSLKV